MLGSRVLEVRGRTSGAAAPHPASTCSSVDGSSYLRRSARRDTVGAQPARQRARAGCCSAVAASSFTAHELTDEEKSPILRAYLKRWKSEVGVFFDGVGPDSSEEQLRAAAPKHPVFRLESISA